MTRIVLAEDHHLVRRGLIALLSNQRDFNLVAEASDGFEAVRLTEKWKPDVLLLDLTLPLLHGFEVIRQVRENCDAKIIVLSMHAGEPIVLEALRAGAAGYIVKDGTLEDLVCAIHAVKAGEIFISPRLRKAALASALKGPKRLHDAYEDLTRQERHVLLHSAEGKSNAEVGGLLHISVRTVEGHRASFMKKLSFSSQTDLVRFAIRRKIIDA